jgi:hypothetical protein
MRKIFFIDGLWPTMSLNAVVAEGPIAMILLDVGLELLMEFFPR